MPDMRSPLEPAPNDELIGLIGDHWSLGTQRLRSIGDGPLARPPARKYLVRIMPILSCPACGAPTPRLLKAPNKYAFVKYYECPNCAHVWTIAKDNPEVVTHITPLPKESSKKARHRRDT
jgi:hypothetical protein